MIQEIRKNHLHPRQNKIVRSLKKLLRLRGEPRKIALGFALGLFIGMSPSMGFQTAIAIFFAALLKWNKISAAIGVWITNPVTAPFIYSVTYLTGAKLLGIKKAMNSPAELDQSISALTKLIQKAPEFIWALILGGIILGIPVAVAGYYIAYYVVLGYQRDIKRRIAIRREMRAKKREETKCGEKKLMADQEKLP